MLTYADFDYELIDCGGCGRLERFGPFTLDRSCPQAMWPQTVESAEPDVFFDRKTGWQSESELSGLSDNKIRWICDDVVKFMTREVKRGNKYDGIILDPPAFGRGAKRDWKIERDLAGLMKLLEQLLTDDPLFVILTCHAPDHFSAQYFAQLLQKLPQFSGKTAEQLDLTIPSKDGTPLPSSFGARIG